MDSSAAPCPRDCVDTEGCGCAWNAPHEQPAAKRSEFGSDRHDRPNVVPPMSDKTPAGSSGPSSAAPLRPVREFTPREIVEAARFEGKLVVIGPTEYEMLLDIVDAARTACRGTAGDGTVKALGDAVREWEEAQRARP